MRKISVNIRGSQENLSLKEAEELYSELGAAIAAIRQGSTGRARQDVEYIDRTYVLTTCITAGMRAPGRVWTRMCVAAERHIKDLRLTCAKCGRDVQDQFADCRGCEFPYFYECRFKPDDLLEAGDRLLGAQIRSAGTAVKDGFRLVLDSIRE